MGIANAFTVDVEEWFHIAGIHGLKRVSQWDRYESRVVGNTMRLLDIMEEKDVRGTFFILGWIAEKYPGLVKEIHKRGHELGTHGYDHRPVYELDADKFRARLRRSVKALEDVTGEKVDKHRAPSFSINERSAWAFDVLAQEGFLYDSSIFFGRKDVGGTNHPLFFERSVFGIDTPYGRVIEFPLTTTTVLCKNIPVIGGGYMRAIPLFVIKRLIKRLHKDGVPMCLYVHPSDIDKDRLVPSGVGIRKKFNATVGVKRAEKKLRKLMDQYEFCTMGEIVDQKGLLAYKRLRTR